MLHNMGGEEGAQLSTPLMPERAGLMGHVPETPPPQKLLGSQERAQEQPPDQSDAGDCVLPYPLKNDSEAGNVVDLRMHTDEDEGLHGRRLGEYAPTLPEELVCLRVLI